MFADKAWACISRALAGVVAAFVDLNWMGFVVWLALIEASQRRIDKSYWTEC